MDLREYFVANSGIGILSTADSQGRVDSAVYSKPHVIDENTLLFVMGDKLTHHNLTQNPHALYLFQEKGDGFKGKRIALKKIKESGDPAEIEATCKEAWPGAYNSGYCTIGQFVVYFNIESIMPLVGAGS